MVDNPRNYINNKSFYADITEYLISREKDPSLVDKEIPRHIVDYFIKLAKKLSTNHKFFKYDSGMKSIMCAEGIMACCRYVDRFNYKKYDNPFAYYTSFIYNAFLQVIKAEKMNSNVKKELIEQHMNESVYNHRLVDYNDNNSSQSEIQQTNSNDYFVDTNTSFTPLKIKQSDGSVRTIQTEEEWVKESFDIVLKKYGCIDNIPPHKKFGGPVDTIITNLKKEASQKIKDEDDIEEVTKNYMKIIKEESNSDVFIDEELWNE